MVVRNHVFHVGYSGRMNCYRCSIATEKRSAKRASGASENGFGGCKFATNSAVADRSKDEENKKHSRRTEKDTRVMTE